MNWFNDGHSGTFSARPTALKEIPAILILGSWFRRRIVGRACPTTRTSATLSYTLSAHFVEMAEFEKAFRPFGSYFQEDARLFGDQAQPFQVRAYAQTRFVAQLGGNAFREDGSHVLAPYPRQIQRGTQRANSLGNCRDQCGAGRPSLEKV